ncbi:S53 family peptidase [Actinacidiphila sp. ITFR-21]|uniref:S53 family peptidase n=1 Tax=Actinacidiphila sp. ITFR-21 TaxID=3075199 RepID=UPI00288A2A1A|nr:S53 family peptidase [Streptomyces sp. ITFR-21]WNI14565.1 S53 family peptidase [Streptomyces sp. ITFR-21]
MRTPRPRPCAVTAAAGAAALTAAALIAAPFTGTATAAATPAAPAPAAAGPAVRPVPAVAGHRLVKGADEPLSDEQCRATWGISCYTPLQYRRAYGLDPLYRAGITGRGRTVVVVDSFGSPTIQHDLDVYSKQFGLPSTTVQVVKWGDVPAFDPADNDHTSWAGESTLDVEMAHAVAPGARIVLVETGVAETEGVTGLPEMMDAEKYLIDHGVGDVVTQSFGATENTFPGFGQGDFSSIRRLRYAFEDARRRGVTVLASSGDGGATDAAEDGRTDYPYPVNSWPSADPLVTSVGGTRLHLDAEGDRTAPDSVYNDYGAGGGGRSNVFPRPAYQDGVRNVVGDRRGTPDISMSAAVDGGAWVYSSYDPTAAGWEVYGGTSESSPLFAGIVALADQFAGRRLGDIHTALYALAEGDVGSTGIVDVDDGTDTTYDGVPGYTAVRGYDLATGVGTPDAARFVPALAAAARPR